MTDWRNDIPSWHDAGRIQLRRSDGTIVFGQLIADDVCHDDEDEYPVWALELDDGTKSDINDFVEWRKI